MNSGKDRGQFGGFRFQGADAGRGQQIAILSQLKPQQRFIGFLQDAADLVNPIGFATSATGSAITGSDGCCRAQNLISNHLALSAVRKRIRHRHHSQCKFLCSGLKLFSIHSARMGSSGLLWKPKS